MERAIRAAIADSGVTPEEMHRPGFDLLRRLGFTPEEIQRTSDYTCGMQTVEGAPGLRGEHLAGVHQRADRRHGVVQLVRDDADLFLPHLDFVGAELARELLEQQQAVRHGVEQEPALRHVVDLRLTAQLQREQGIAATLDGFLQRLRRGLENGRIEACDTFAAGTF